MKKTIALTIILAIIFLFTSCFPQAAVKFNINFIVDGEVYSTVKTDRNSIEMPADPIKDGYGFDGWFWDKDVWEKPLTLNSLMDAPLSETWRVYAKFTNNNILPSVTSSRFYRLQEAYDYDILNYGDFHDIAFYNNGNYYGSTLSRAAFPKNPEFLSIETENKIKQTFLDEYNLSAGNVDNYTLNDISITNYCGTYNNAVVVFIEGLYGYIQALTSETVAGITFNYRDGNHLRVFVEGSDTSIPFSVGQITNTCAFVDSVNDYTTILRSPFSCIATSDLLNGFEFWLDYDEEFFVENALVVYIFHANTAGGVLDVLKLSKQSKDLIMDINFQAGYDDALSYWTVVLEVKKSDIVGISNVEIKTNNASFPFPYATEANLVEKYLLTFKAYIWNDYMPSYDASKSNNYIEINTGAIWIEPVPHPFYGYLAMSVRIVTANKDFQVSYSNYNSGRENQFRSVTKFRLDDNEKYTIYVTIAFGGEKQTIELTGTVGVTH